jgi:hypothetical protein
MSTAKGNFISLMKTLSEKPAKTESARPEPRRTRRQQAKEAAKGSKSERKVR